VYHRILIAIEHSAADATILDHVRALAGLTGAELLLVHVADGWVARNYNELQLRESEEMRDDRRYLEEITADLQGAGLSVTWRLGMGDPATEILRIAREADVDLIAMATHGHRGLEDLVRGTTVNKVRHAATVPVLLLRARAQPAT
jgi:nucleotide-binding universal stress UspA family protein